MKNQKCKISFGFVSQDYVNGVHICQIFNKKDKSHGTIIGFLMKN